jgi:hypothetical protein
MPPFTRENAFRRPKNTSELSGSFNKSSFLRLNTNELNDTETETETDSYEDKLFNSWFPEGEIRDNLLKMQKNIAYVYVRGHSELPYNNTDGDIPFDTYKIPDSMDLTKITAAPNGDVNISYYDYQDKKDTITSGIRAFNDAVVSEEGEKNDAYTAAAYIAGRLKRYEKKMKENIPNYKERNIISENKVVLNKIIMPLSKEEQTKRRIENYITVQILFLDDTDDTFNSLDIYPLIHRSYRTNRLIKGYNEAIKMADIIKFLHEYLKLTSVVLLDFTCSSHNSENKEALMNNLNDKDLHGGKPKKTKKMIKKRTKKNKSKKKKTKTRRNKK